MSDMKKKLSIFVKQWRGGGSKESLLGKIEESSPTQRKSDREFKKFSSSIKNDWRLGSLSSGDKERKGRGVSMLCQ